MERQFPETRNYNLQDFAEFLVEVFLLTQIQTLPLGEKREGEREEEIRATVYVRHWILFFLWEFYFVKKLALFCLLLTLGGLAFTHTDGQKLCSCQGWNRQKSMGLFSFFGATES